MAQKSSALSNAELMLLQIILEQESISGYDLNKLVERQNVRDWADLGTTSIYISLKKLDKKKLVTAFIDKKKSGKGPPPRRFSVSTYGKKVLTNEILKSLANTGERDKRFDIAFSGINYLPRIVVILAIEKRIEYLMFQFEQAETAGANLGKNPPLHKKAIQDHRMFLLGNEIEFMQSLLDKLRDRSVEL